MTSPDPVAPRWSAYAGCALTLGLLWYFLFAWFPYTAGYEFSDKSLFQFVRSGWGSGDGQWEHCVLVPFIALGLVWWRRKQLSALPIDPANGALLLLAASLFFYWVGFVVDQRYLGYLGLQGMTGAVIAWSLGWRQFRVLFFPWLFLLFMWPVLFLDNMLAFPLRQIMSALSHIILNVFGVDNIQRGTAILSAAIPAEGVAEGARFSLDVANPCSGIRSLFALMMVSALYGYLVLPTSRFFTVWREKSAWRDFLASGADAWRQWVIFACALPLAVAGNILRILLLTFGTMAFGSEFAIGLSEDDPSGFHMFAGFAVFALALVGMVALGKLLVVLPTFLDRLRRGEWRSKPGGEEESVITY